MKREVSGLVLNCLVEKGYYVCLPLIIKIDEKDTMATVQGHPEGYTIYSFLARQPIADQFSRVLAKWNPYCRVDGVSMTCSVGSIEGHRENGRVTSFTVVGRNRHALTNLVFELLASLSAYYFVLLDELTAQLPGLISSGWRVELPVNGRFRRLILRSVSGELFEVRDYQGGNIHDYITRLEQD